MQHKLAGVTDPKPSWVRHYTHMRLLTRRLAILMLAKPVDWVVEESSAGFTFDPVRPGRYTEPALFMRIPHIVLISATIRPKTLYLLGQAKGSFDYWEFDSDFDPHRCPIYYLPIQRVDYRVDNLAPTWLKLDQIAARRTDRKGLVQTISFIRRDEVMARSRFAASMLINPQGEPPTAMLEQFFAAGPGTILTSPSVGSGYSFDFRKAEWQFICKIPFPPPSKILKARTADDREYPYYLAWNKLAQIVGRLMRDQQDRGESFIGDMHMDWFIKYSYLAPKTFKLFFKRVDYVPPPPPKL
jgi:Rad3-related DNA helicase